jgi:hypothetical protein
VPGYDFPHEYRTAQGTHAEGDLDFRGTLGVAKDAPVGFKCIRLRFHLDADATEDQIATLLKLTEHYCVVAKSLRARPSPAFLRRVARDVGSEVRTEVARIVADAVDEAGFPAPQESQAEQIQAGRFRHHAALVADIPLGVEDR